MFEFLTVFALVVLALTVLSGTGAFALHVMYGSNLPPNVARLADIFTDVYKAGAGAILGILRIVRRPSEPPPTSKSLPPPKRE